MELVSDFEKEKDVLVILQPELGAHSMNFSLEYGED